MRAADDRESVTSATDLGALERVTDRSSFLYLERTHVHRDNNAIIAVDASGTTYIPGAGLACLLLGPGTTISHDGLMLLADNGVGVAIVGESGVRMYAHGRSLAASSRHLIQQAKTVSNPRLRLAAARRLHRNRYPDIETSNLTIRQMLGQEGSRVKRAYREHADRTGIPWTGRSYEMGNWSSNDPVNQALSAGNAALYGAVHSAIVAVGCAPGLVIIHTGTDRALVYDIADQFKADTTIPAAFDAVAAGAPEPGRAARHFVRDRIFTRRILDRAVDSLMIAIGSKEDPFRDESDGTHAPGIWDGISDIAGGINHGDNE